ncbi:MAG: discoidin domain-containing protein [Candidatus Methanomethylicaceae archaeon]
MAPIVLVLGWSLSLGPAGPSLADDEDEALIARRTDWFSKAGYGVFVHFLDSVQNNPEHVASLGKKTTWEECVREFNVELFAKRMEEAGAGYVIFTVMQRSRHMIAPNATFDRLTGYRPGEACATRDLIDELYQALNRRGIQLMLYWTGDGPCDDPQAAKGLRWPGTDKVSLEFVRNWADVAREYGQRYGSKVKGWWVDGCYRWLDYDEEKLGVLAEALRAGYPDRIIAFNPGVEERVRAYSRHEDYTCGEQNAFLDVPLARFVDGKQWHILSYLGTNWAQPGTVKGKAELARYVHRVNAVGGVVSIDVVAYRDGDLDRSQLEVLKALRPRLEALRREQNAWREGRAVPPRNKAWRKPALLLNVEGAYELGASGAESVHGPQFGVDGDPATAAEAGGEWAWTYEVDLLAREKVSRIVVRFGPGYATDFAILASLDRENWQVLGRFTEQRGEPVEIALDSPIEARFVRVRAYKPDGPDQPGVQMMIAEVEVYED